MIDIINLNSKNVVKITIDYDDMIARLDFLARKAKKIPVYLVNELLMDRIYPPFKRKVLDEEHLHSIFPKDRKNYDWDDLDFDDLWRERGNVMVAVGLYVHRPFPDMSAIFGDVLEKKEYDKISFPSIFICPERVISWANNLKISQNVLFQKVYFHELGHAYIHTDRRDYQRWHYRIIEEAYCNAVAVSRFTNKNEIAQVVTAISAQSLEYQAYPFFYLTNNDKLSYNFNLNYMIDHRELRYFYHRYIDLFEELIHHTPILDNLRPFFTRYIRSLEELAITSPNVLFMHPMPLFPILPIPLTGNVRTFPKIWKSNMSEEYFKFIAFIILWEMNHQSQE